MQHRTHTLPRLIWLVVLSAMFASLPLIANAQDGSGAISGMDLTAAFVVRFAAADRAFRRPV